MSGPAGMATGQRIAGQLVCGGGFHDFDYARLRMCELFAADERLRVRVDSVFPQDLDDIRFLVSYTCDMRPSPEVQAAIVEWITAGGRWFALHATNSVIELTDAGVECPNLVPL